MTDYGIYNNPLITRYASKEMQYAFSDDKRYQRVIVNTVIRHNSSFTP